MSFSDDWIKLLSVVTIISAIISAVVPKSACKKSFSVLCSVVLICVFIVPFEKNITDYLSEFDAVNKSKEEISEELSEQSVKGLRKAGEEGIEKVVSDFLKSQKISFTSVTAVCEIKNEKLIIEKITIFSSIAPENKDKVKKELYSLLGSECEIIFVVG